MGVRALARRRGAFPAGGRGFFAAGRQDAKLVLDWSQTPSPSEEPPMMTDTLIIVGSLGVLILGMGGGLVLLINRVDKRIDGLDKRIDGLEKRIDKLEGDNRQMYGTLCRIEGILTRQLASSPPPSADKAA